MALLSLVVEKKHSTSSTRCSVPNVRTINKQFIRWCFAMSTIIVVIQCFQRKGTHIFLGKARVRSEALNQNGVIARLRQQTNRQNNLMVIKEQSGLSRSTKSSDNEEKIIENEIEFDSLDIMLNRARQRNQFPFAFGRFQAAVSGSAFPPPLAFLSRADVVLIIVAATALDAKGFALGLALGKATVGPLRLMLPRGQYRESVVQVWHAVLGALCDRLL